MLGKPFQSGGKGEQFICGIFRRGDKIGHARFPGGEGSGLIKNSHIDFMEIFQRSCIFEEDPQFCRAARTHHDRHRRGKSQRTGTADDQNCDGGTDGFFRRSIQNHPGGKSDDCDPDHNRHKNGTDFICQPCNGCFGSGSFLHQRNDLCQCGFPAYFFRTEFEIAAGTDTAGDDRIPDSLFHRDAFPRDCRLIHRPRAIGHSSVNRRRRSGTEDHDIAGSDRSNADFLFFPVPFHLCCFRCESHQFCNGSAGLSFADTFKIFSNGDQDGDHSRRLKIKIGTLCTAQHQKKHSDTVYHARTGSDSDQGIHIGCSPEQTAESESEISAVDDQDRYQQNALDHSRSCTMPCHGDDREGNEKNQADKDIAQEGCTFFFCFFRRIRFLFIFHKRSLESEAGNFQNNAFRLKYSVIVLHRQFLCRKIDFGFFYTIQRSGSRLHMSLTRSAAHSIHTKHPFHLNCPSKLITRSVYFSFNHRSPAFPAEL